MERKTCRSCSSCCLQSVMTLGNQYLADFRGDDELPESHSLDLVLCQECFLLQLKNTVPLSSLFTENYGYRSSINGTIRANLEEIVQEAKSLVSLEASDVMIDIGANDGTLLSYYGKGDVYKVGFEPIQKLAKECSFHADEVINDFFHANKEIPLAKIITAISMFYDLEDPHSFLEDVKSMLQVGGVFVIQQNYLVSMLEQNAFDNIVHEHLQYYSLLSLEFLLHQHELEVFRVVYTPINGGSFRTLICRKGERVIENSVFQCREREKLLKLEDKEIYLRFAEQVKVQMEKLYEFVSEKHKLGKTIYLYGASTRGNHLLQYAGLGSNFIEAAVERNLEKVGKKISALQIPIISEEEAREKHPDYMLVLPWFFKEEFIQREKEYLDKGGSLIFPLPAFEVVDWKK